VALRASFFRIVKLQSTLRPARHTSSVIRSSLVNGVASPGSAPRGSKKAGGASGQGFCPHRLLRCRRLPPVLAFRGWSWLTRRAGAGNGETSIETPPGSWTATPAARASASDTTIVTWAPSVSDASGPDGGPAQADDDSGNLDLGCRFRRGVDEVQERRTLSGRSEAGLRTKRGPGRPLCAHPRSQPRASETAR
jgi:hypothetical protein